MAVNELLEVGHLAAGLPRNPLGLFGAEPFDKFTSVHIQKHSISLLDCNSFLQVAPSSKRLSNIHMDILMIRRQNLIGLLQSMRSKTIRNDADFARMLEMSDRLISQWKNGTRGIGHASARKLEERLKKPRGWMDQAQFAVSIEALQQVVSGWGRLTPGRRRAILALVETGLEETQEAVGKISAENQTDLTEVVNLIGASQKDKQVMQDIAEGTDEGSPRQAAHAHRDRKGTKSGKKNTKTKTILVGAGGSPPKTTKRTKGAKST